MRLLVAAILFTAFQAFAQGFTGSSPDPEVKMLAKPTTLARAAIATGENAFQFPATVPAGGTAAGAYRYYIASKESPAPLAKDGFRVAMPLNRDDLAGKEEGYPDADANGWPCRNVEWNKAEYRIYRLKRQINGSIQLRVKTK